MTMAEDFETSKKAYQFLAGHVGEWKKGVEKANRGRDHTVNKMASEIEDLQANDEKIYGRIESICTMFDKLHEKQDKIAAYLKKKHPEDFGDKS